MTSRGDIAATRREVGDTAAGTPTVIVREPQPPGGSFLNGPAVHRMASVLGPLLLLALWEASSRAGLLDRRFFPGPLSIVGDFYYLTFEVPASRSLPTHVLASLTRAGTGFLLGAVPAIVLGVVMGLVPLVRSALQPVVGALYPIPATVECSGAYKMAALHCPAPRGSLRRPQPALQGGGLAGP